MPSNIFANGAPSGAPSARNAYPSSHLFIEVKPAFFLARNHRKLLATYARTIARVSPQLEEKHGAAWTETGRWNHALTEESFRGGLNQSGAPKWSRPHLPSISVPSLMKLRQAFSFEGSVLLDMEGVDFPSVVDSVLGKLVASGRLPQQSVLMARAALSRLEALPDSPIIPPMGGSPKQRSPKGLGSPSAPRSPDGRSPKDKLSPGAPDAIELPASAAPSATHSPKSTDVTRTRLGNVPAKGSPLAKGASPKAKTGTPSPTGPKHAGGPGASTDGAPSSFTLEPALGLPSPHMSPQRPMIAGSAEDADWFHMLEPDGMSLHVPCCPRAASHSRPPRRCAPYSR